MKKPSPPAPLVLHADSAMQRRTLLRAGGLLLLLGASEIAWGARILAVRMWPADEYTRLTIESDSSLKYTQSLAHNPPRVVVDIEGLQLDAKLQELLGQVRSDDPFVSQVRVGQNSPEVVRLVLDLKQEVKPQVFTLPPVAAYGNRLVLDLYPTQERDPLQELISGYVEEQSPQASSADLEDQIATLLAQQLARAPAVAAAPALGSSAAAPAVADGLGDFLRQRATPEPVLAAAPRPTPAPVAIAKTPPPAPPKPPAVSRTRTPTPEPVLASSRDKRLIIVALDPGHGGEDPGAIGPTGVREKDVVLQIARKLEARINRANIGGRKMRAYLTRDADYFVPLGKRVEKARAVRADLFISIHADAFTRPSARGASVFALSERGGSSAEARWLAGTQNQADAIGGINIKANRSVQGVLASMSVGAQIRDSLKVGDHLLQSIGSFAHLHKRQVEQAGFAVLKAPDIPSVLVETAFISNPEEEQRLNSAAYQDRLADGLMRGIERYFSANPPIARG